MIASLLARARGIAGAAKGFLVARALPILGTALILVATSFAWQTWRIDRLKTDLAEERVALNTCLTANKTNQATISELGTVAQDNAKRYRRALDAQTEAITRADQLETELQERTDGDIETIERAGADVTCAHQPLPDAIRVRLNAGRDRDQDGDEVRRPAGSDRP